MKFQIYIPLTLLFTFFLISGCGSTETITTHSMETDIEIDGSLSGWPMSDALIHNSEEFNYYVMQDSDHLYIYVDFKSPFYNRAVENSGFIVYLSDNENIKKRRGIGYPTGAFNLLREDPDTYSELTRDHEWFNNPQNQRRLESLQEENFNQVLIVERYEDNNNPQYGFVTYSQIEAEGLELAAALDQRYYGLEFKIPLNRSAPYELERGKAYWLGFAIEPPEFNFRNNDDMQNYNSRNRRRGGVYSTGRSSSANQNSQMRRYMGQYEEWFKVEIN